MRITKFNPAHIALLGAAVAIAPAALYAQSDSMSPGASATQANNPNQRPTASTSMQDSAGGAGMAGQAMKDKMFLRKSAQGGMAEVQLGQLAAQKASSEDVKAFGQKMVTDHTALNEQMKPIAEQMGVMLPKKVSQADQAEYDKLNGLSGNDFDSEYISFMVKDHHKDLREFRDEARSAADPTLKEAVTKGEAVIRDHTMMADKLAKDKGIQTPGRKSSAASSQ